MTYNVLMETLNPTHSLIHCTRRYMYRDAKHKDNRMLKNLALYFN